MCGIAGFINPELTNGMALTRYVSQMTAALSHRGPDDEGAWVEEPAGLALGHRRLAVQDLSPAGHQPMTSHCGRWVIVYNGETYSGRELRPLLAARGIVFQGQSDTEIIVEAVSAWGVEETAKQLIGMFAFAIWDRKDHSLYLVRDRLGIKPLYWGQTCSAFLFGSEPKAFLAYPGFSPRICSQALAAYLKYGYVPAPYSIYEQVEKLLPGTILCRSIDGKITQKVFWSLEDVIQKGASSHLQNAATPPSQALDGLGALLKDAIQRRLVSDVPLGSLLSGGIDSTLVTAIAQQQSAQPLQTFTIGFGEKDYDEAPYARAIARHLGTCHTELSVTPRQARDVIPLLPQIYNEPFADASQIPTFLVSRLARQSVTVALTGDGGDEVFGGYSRYLWANSLWPLIRHMPFRNGVATLLESIPSTGWDALARLVPATRRPLRLGEKIHKVARCLPAKTPQALYELLVSRWVNPSRLLLQGSASKLPVFPVHLPDIAAQMQALDTITYLPDDVLAKVDRASMAVGLEARVPLLDHRLVEWAWAQPQSLRIRTGTGKWALRQLLGTYVPQELINRPKSGFTLPMGAWLRGPLRDWAESLLDARTLKETFDPLPIRKLWNCHLSGRSDHQECLWTILMFEAWRRNGNIH